MNVGDRVRHIFRSDYGIGTISVVNDRGCLVTWTQGGTSFEPRGNLEIVEET